MLEAAGDGPGVNEASLVRSAGERGGAEAEHGGTTHHDQDDADPQVDLRVGQEPGGDALVDDVGLLEEQLPWRHRGAHDADDQQHHRGQLRAGREHRGHEGMGHLGDRGVGEDVDGDQQQ